MRLSLITVMVTFLLLLCSVFIVADKVQYFENKQKSLQAKIAAQEEGVRVLQAEWTYLTNPVRLQKLAVEHFNLMPTDGAQYIELAAIPTRDFVEQQVAMMTPKADPEALSGIEPGQASSQSQPSAIPAALPQPVAALPPLQATPVNVVASAAVGVTP